MDEVLVQRARVVRDGLRFEDAREEGGDLLQLARAELCEDVGGDFGALGFSDALVVGAPFGAGARLRARGGRRGCGGCEGRGRLGAFGPGGGRGSHFGEQGRWPGGRALLFVR